MSMIAMARGTLVLDENSLNLEKELSSHNIRILTPESGMSDEKIKKMLLSNRIIVTRNSKDFIEDASSYDYGIIAIENLKGSPEEVAKLISRAILKHKLWSKRHGFIVTFRFINNSYKSGIRNLTY